jgi:hypothetical protein
VRGFPSLHPRERAPAEERAKLAAHTLIGILTETVITWIEIRTDLLTGSVSSGSATSRASGSASAAASIACERERLISLLFEPGNALQIAITLFHIKRGSEPKASPTQMVAGARTRARSFSERRPEAEHQEDHTDIGQRRYLCVIADKAGPPAHPSGRISYHFARLRCYDRALGQLPIQPSTQRLTTMSAFRKFKKQIVAESFLLLGVARIALLAWVLYLDRQVTGPCPRRR